jgi:hypothetical protein
MKKNLIKHSILFFLLFLQFNVNSSFAQCPEPLGMTTNPSNPLNNDPSAIPIGLPKNKFQWYSTGYTNNGQANLQKYQTSFDGVAGNIANPFNDGQRYLFAKSQSNGGIDGSDYKPEDGWELIKADLGLYADEQHTS